MRRHERPRQANMRVEVPVGGNWRNLSLAQQRTHIYNQVKSLGNVKEQPQMKCLCGNIVPIRSVYRCYECGAFWCPKCSAKHFSKAKKAKGAI